LKYQKRASYIGCAFNEEAIERMLELKFKKKPVVIDAIHFTGDNADEILAWAGDRVRLTPNKEIVIHTFEGPMFAPTGWWIIKGVKGEFYGCDPDIFKMSYERTYEE
jgi:hypothetical protein